MQAIETLWHLEMTDPGQLLAAPPPEAPLEIVPVGAPYPELNRFFYTSVGADWYWIDRLDWDYDQWRRYLARPGHETWIAYLAGTPAGYFELDGQPHGDVELAMFGLLPQFTGRGLGKYLLTFAVRRAWEKPASRVWLHTCSFDHPHAVANYEARGFHLFRTEQTTKEMPERSPGPWPGSGRIAAE